MMKNVQMPQDNRVKKVCTTAETKTMGSSTDFKNQDLSDQDFWMGGSVLDNL